MLKNLLIFCLLALPFAALSQSDSTESEVIDFYEDDDEEVTLPYGTSDTVMVEARTADPGLIDRLKSDPEMQYEQPPTIAESFWQRFLIWLSILIHEIFNAAENTSWGRLMMYLLGLGALILVIMLILKVDAFKVFYSGQGASTMKYNVLDENIHEIDFDREIDVALNAGDYRRGVRLLFLYALKILSDKQHIAWQQGKTNHDYVLEVREESVQRWLRELSYYFDYAWYGNFTVSRALFDKVQGIFSGGKGNIR